MKKSYIIAAASVFAAGTLATAAHAQSTNKCYGINACKGAERLQQLQDLMQGQERLQGSGHGRHRHVARVHRSGRQPDELTDAPTATNRRSGEGAPRLPVCGALSFCFRATAIVRNGSSRIDHAILNLV